MININTIKKAFKGHYKIINEIGRGGMAVVYKAIHLNLNRVVALKVVPKEFSENNEFKIRFEREAKDAAILQHPNIITIYDHGNNKGFQYISMAYLSGGTLASLIKQKGRLHEFEAKELLIKILHGISYAHKKGIIHRDIKASNIMFDENSNPVIMDFGISKSKDNIGLTISGTFIGTLEYASPEQIESSDLVDSRSDLYSIGILAYEMLTGSVPFKGSMTSVINHVVNTPVPRLDTLNLNVSTDFANIISKAIQKNPDDRYNSADEFIEDLQKLNFSIHDKKKHRKTKELKTSVLKKSYNKKNKNDFAENKKKKNIVYILLLLIVLLISLTIYMLNGLYFKKSEITQKNNTLHTSPHDNSTNNNILNLNPQNNNSEFSKIKVLYGINMIKVKGGKFLMGSSSGEKDERPEHIVKVNDFFISSKEITRKTWKKVFNNLPDGNSGCDDCPVTNVSWYEAKEFVDKLSKITNINFYLPTEIEWEYAAKEGVYSNYSDYVPVYSGNINPNKVGWYLENSNGKIHQVGLLKPNKLRLYDMSGNAWEWCSDYYRQNYYSLYMENPNPNGPLTGEYKVIRGGSFLDDKVEMRVTNREKYIPNRRRNNIGFRIVSH